MTDLQGCIERLGTDDEAERIYAAEDIGYANEGDGVEPLLRRLTEEPSRAVREAIFGALLQIEDDGVIEGAISLLDSEDCFLRNQAVELLRARGGQAIPFLQAAFSKGNSDRRKFVIDVVGELGEAASSEIYELALIDSDLNVVITAVESLGHTRKTAFREQVERLLAPGAHPMLLCACFEALVQIGSPASVDAVRTRLGPGQELAAYLLPSYLKLIGARGSADDVGEIAAMIVREGLEAPVVNALTALRNRHRGMALPECLLEPLRTIATRNGSPLHSYQAIRLLSVFLGDADVFRFMTGFLKHPEKALRIGAVQALREAGGERADAVLSESLADEEDSEILQAWRGKNGE